MTLTGAGGCGKTRLALAVAEGIAADYPDGVWLIDLAPVSDPRLVAGTAASLFGVQEQPGIPVTETLADALKQRTLLLLLDNCEHIVAACAAFTDAVLQICPHVRVLATSRTALGLTGETRWRVPSLSLPGPGTETAGRRPADYEAVQLFLERARAVSPSFDVTARNGAAVLQICRRLDGIPLAIELAAARVRALGVEEIAARLDDRLLVDASPTTAPRHRTLEAVTDWSYELLSREERRVFRRLAVFAGGWTLDAAQAVCADVLAADAVLDLVIQLVDKSLAAADTREAGARYRMLETVREYGLSKLAQTGEEGETRRRHRDWYLLLAERAEPHLTGNEQKVWLDILDLEHDNLRAALDWSERDPDGAGPELGLAGALYWFWFLRGHWSEGRGRLEAALARSADAPPAVLPKALQGAMFFAWRQGDFGRAIELGKRGLAACDAQRDGAGRARLLTWLAGAALQQGDHTRAAAQAKESLALARRLDDTWLISLALGNLGNVARHRGDYEKAAAHYDECLTVSRETGDSYRIAYSLRNVGNIALHQRDYDRAAAAYKQSLVVGREIRDRWVAEECFGGLAGVACARGEYEHAARLLGVADAVRQALGHRLFPVDHANYERLVAAVRERLGAVRFAAAGAEGQAMTLEEAVGYALVPVATKPRTGPIAGGLSPREVEVAALIAHGLTNREIARRLVIAPRTVDIHVEHILSKLGVRSRSQVAVWAAELGLRAPSAAGDAPVDPRQS